MKEIEEIRDKMPGSTGVISDLGNTTATCISSSARAHKVERSRSKGLKPALTRHSAITHQRSNGAGNKDARSEAGAGNAPAASRNGGKVGNGKPVGSQLQKGSGNGKSATQGAGQGASQGKPAGKPAHKGKTPTRAGSAKPGAKPATQGGKPAAKGNGAKRPAR